MSEDLARRIALVRSVALSNLAAEAAWRADDAWTRAREATGRDRALAYAAAAGAMQGSILLRQATGQDVTEAQKAMAVIERRLEEMAA
jgi:hypothetical protein